MKKVIYNLLLAMARLLEPRSTRFNREVTAAIEGRESEFIELRPEQWAPEWEQWDPTDPYLTAIRPARQGRLRGHRVKPSIRSIPVSRFNHHAQLFDARWRPRIMSGGMRHWRVSRGR